MSEWSLFADRGGWLGLTEAWPVVLAGMPSFGLSELARVRIEALSFFGAVLLLSAWGVRGIWNSLGRDFLRLPRLTFPKALGVVALWGLLFVIVLTMISGARELMTPGAWQQQEWTYRLRQDASPTTAQSAVESNRGEETLAVRRERMRLLWRTLLEHAVAHDGRFPPTPDEQAAAATLWQLPHVPGMRYYYVEGRTVGTPGSVLAYEPQIDDGPALALLTDGEVLAMTASEIRQALESEPAP